jgi:hypothetical protein
VILAIMVIVPLLLVVRPLFPGALGYGKQNVPYGPAISAMLSEGKDRPSIILAGDQQLGGNIRLHGGGIPVTEPRYQEFERPFVFDATHPVLVVWRRLSKGEGRAAPKLPSKLRAWLDAKADTAGKEIEVRDIALPYHFGQDGDVYHFSYAWVYPAGGP